MKTIHRLLAVILGLAALFVELRVFTEAELEKAGREALQSFKQSIAANPAEHGFKDAQELEKLRLSPAIPLCMLDRAALAQKGPTAERATILQAPQNWYFIASLDSEPRSVVSIAVLRGTETLAPEAFGKVVLAKSLNLFLTKYSAVPLLIVAGRNPLDAYVHIKSEARPNRSPLTGDLKITAAFVKRPADAESVLASLAAE